MFSVFMLVPLEDIPYRCVSSHADCICIPCLIPGLVLSMLNATAVCVSVCVCVWFIFSIFVWVDWTVCWGQRGGGSATVNKGRIVRKMGCTGDLSFLPQLLELKQFKAFLGGVVKGGIQKACSLTIATCQSHATPADREQCPDHKF